MERLRWERDQAFAVIRKLKGTDLTRDEHEAFWRYARGLGPRPERKVPTGEPK
jgi:hypothetical protein